MNYLLISRNYGNHNSANGICARNISVAIQEIDEKAVIHCISSDPIVKYEDKTIIHRISPRFSEQKPKSFFGKMLFKLYLLLRNIHLFFFYPLDDFSYEKRIKKESLKIIKNNKIEVVIGFYKPIETINALNYIKKKTGIICIAYHLDIITESTNNNKFLSCYKKRRGINYLNRSIKKIDRIFLPLPNTIENKFENVCYVAPPLFCENIIKMDEIHFNENIINIVYVGSLDETNRNIEQLLIILRRIKKEIPILLHIWGKMDNYSLKLTENYSDVSIYHGMLDNEFVSYVFSISDYVLDVVNQTTKNMIPSKIFQMMASKKYILVFSPSDQYAEKNIIEEYSGFIEVINDKRLDIVISKLLKYRNCRVNSDDKLFYQYTPAYHANLIIKECKNVFSIKSK